MSDRYLHRLEMPEIEAAFARCVAHADVRSADAVLRIVTEQVRLRTPSNIVFLHFLFPGSAIFVALYRPSAWPTAVLFLALTALLAYQELRNRRRNGQDRSERAQIEREGSRTIEQIVFHRGFTPKPLDDEQVKIVRRLWRRCPEQRQAFERLLGMSL